MAGSATQGTVLANLTAGNQALSLIDADFAQLFSMAVALSSYANYYTDTGAANAYAITVSAPQTVALAAGLPIQFKATNANTGASTLQINALAAKSIVNPDGTATVPGQIQAGAVITVMYDGTSFFLMGGQLPLSRTDVQAVGRNIAARTNSGTPNTKIDITADAITLLDTNNNSYVARTVSGTIDFGTVGANGIDTGTQAVSTWYYGWVIFNPSTNTVAVLGSTSSSAPTMPSGYTFKALATAARSDGSTHFVKYRQLGNEVYYETQQQILTGGTATAETSISTAAQVPPNALSVMGSALTRGSTNGSVGQTDVLELRTISGAAQIQIGQYAQVLNVRNDQMSYWLLPNIGQNIYYLFVIAQFSTHAADAYVIGFKLPLGGE